MDKEHVEWQMFQHEIAGLIEPEEEETISKIGQKWHADGGHMAIKLSALNMALVEVHQELSQVRHGAKDMACKNRHARKTKKEHKWQIQELQ